MSRRIDVSDPLSSAIGALREELLRWIDAELVRLRELERPDDSRQAVVETAGTVIAPAGSQPEPELKTPTSSPRERLDALARLLDHRLKKAQGAAESGGSVEMEPSARRDDRA
jgi:hypothetical protein